MYYSKIKYKDRIIELLNIYKPDSDIKKIIYEEYGILISLTDILSIRKSGIQNHVKIDMNNDLDNKAQLVKDLLNENPNIPLTKKEIVKMILSTKKNNITHDEVKTILWNDLKKEIIYNASDWTYTLKKNSINPEEKTLHEYLKAELDLIIRDLFGKIIFIHTNNLDPYLYTKGIIDFNFSFERDFKVLHNLVVKNFLFLEKLFFLIQNISNDFILKEELLEIQEVKLIESDVDLFLDIFYFLFIIDETKIRIKHKFLFNQTKDEIEFLYEAYEKYLGILDKTKNIPDTNKLSKKNNEVSFDKISIDDKVGTNVLYIDKYSSNNIIKIIDNTKFNIIKKKAPLHPLFFYEYDKSNGNHQIILNTVDSNYNKDVEELLIKIATAMVYTKNSMTSKEAEIFINRFHNNLNIIE